MTKGFEIRASLAMMLLMCGAANAGAEDNVPVFILIYSITSSGSTIEDQVRHDFATEAECMAERIKLMEAYQPDRPGDSITAHCEKVKPQG